MSSNYAPSVECWDTGWVDVTALAENALSGLIEHQTDERIGHPVPELDDEDTLTADLPSEASTVEEQITENSMSESNEAERQASAHQATVTFRRLLRGVEEVEGILASETTEGVLMCVITNDPSRDHRRTIYSREWELMQRYLGTGFDFHLIDRRDRPLCDVVSVDDSDIYLRI